MKFSNNFGTSKCLFVLFLVAEVGPFLGNAAPMKKDQHIYHFRTKCHCLITWKRAQPTVLSPGELANGQFHTRPVKIPIAPRSMMYRESKRVSPILEGFIDLEKLKVPTLPPHLLGNDDDSGGGDAAGDSLSNDGEDKKDVKPGDDAKDDKDNIIP